MKMRTDETFAWLCLYLIRGLGNNTLKRLVDHFGGAGKVLEARHDDIAEVEGVKEATARSIVRREFIRDPEEEIFRAEDLGAGIVVFADEAYPQILRQIHSPPMVLYARGSWFPEEMNCIGIVGSRNPTHYGIRTSERMGKGLALNGLGVVSGLATGIDSAAHTGCLLGRGFPIGVLGCGIDIVYPSSNGRLFRDVEDRGLLLSEFPLGTPPEAWNFPVRNRIISGLSLGVVVVEATLKSGSLITASFALDQGREVFAVPGSVDSFKSMGPHFLIKQGARLVENSDDILEELRLSAGGPSSDDEGPQGRTRNFPMSEVEERIFGIIGDYPLHIDQIARAANLNAAAASGILMKMELMGLIRQLPGKVYVR